MRVGISGHQRRPGLDWGWVEGAIRAELASLPGSIIGYTSLAAGADQLFAQAILDVQGTICAIIPVENYEKFFEGDDLREYHRLLSLSEPKYLGISGDPELAFFAAGKAIVDECETLFAVWDGKPSQGTGGTADVVAYAAARHREIVHFQPFERVVLHIENIRGRQ